MDIDVDTKEAIIIVTVIAAAVIMAVFDGLSSENVIAIIGMVMAYGFGRYRNGSVNSSYLQKKKAKT